MRRWTSQADKEEDGAEDRVRMKKDEAAECQRMLDAEDLELLVLLGEGGEHPSPDDDEDQQHHQEIISCAHAGSLDDHAVCGHLSDSSC
jgi:hypothetical protein